MTALTPSQDRLPISLLIGWGIGALSMATIFNGQLLLARFMTDYLGITAAAAGAALGLSKLYDAVTDPVMGVISDNTRSRFGRRRPWLVVGALVGGVAFAMAYSAPFAGDTSASFVFAIAALLLLATGYTIFNIPFLAMPAEMTQDYYERTRVLSFRTGFSAVGQLIAGLAPAMIVWFGGGLQGHATMGLALGALIVVTGIIAFFATASARATQKVESVRVPFLEQARMVATNQPLMMLLAAKLLQLLSIAASSACLIYFLTRVLGKSDIQLTIFFIGTSLVMIASMPIWLRIARAIGKRNAYILAAVCLTAVYLTWLPATAEESDIILYIRVVLLGFFPGGVILFGPSMLPDIMEYDYLRTGLRREGIFAAFYTIMEKAAFALGSALILAFLDWRDYRPSFGGSLSEQPESAIQALYIGVSVIPAVLTLLSCIPLAAYRLDAQRLAALRAEKGIA